ncbi:MAG TPA: integrase, partial [Marinobacter hydrocarbonoclasticus]|nr:integrase [Marinobacter nauticus]
MDITEALEQSRPGMIGQVQAAIRKRELNQRAEQTYLHWISR